LAIADIPVQQWRARRVISLTRGYVGLRTSLRSCPSVSAYQIRKEHLYPLRSHIAIDVAAEIYGCVMSVILNSVSNPPQQWTPYARVHTIVG